MVQVVRTPAFARNLFTANQLCGWADFASGVDFSRQKKKPLKKGKQRKRQNTFQGQKHTVALCTLGADAELV